MGFFSADLESMVELYQREATELMEEFDQKQAEAMRAGSFSAQEINAIFRVVHTIKSSAAMMGLEDISDCTHRMEDLFLLFRDDPRRAEGQENRIFDLMYLFSDYVEEENSRVFEEDFKPQSGGAVLSAIQKEIDFFNGQADSVEAPETTVVRDQPSPAPQEETATGAALESTAGSDELNWRVVLHPNCQMENVRAFMLVRQLEDLCSSITTVPSNLELPDSAAEIAQNGLLMTLRTAQEEKVAEKLSASPYVLRIEAIGHDAPSDPDDEDETQDTAEGNAPNRQNKLSMVSWDHVMRLQNVTGEIITANTILGASLKNLATEGVIENEFQTVTRLCHELEKLVAAVSMMPVSSAMPQYYRLVRDIATKEDKQIRLDVVGEELEVDRQLLDTLANPLIHLLRNAADHGIETPEARAVAGKDPGGTITLKFENLTDHLLVTVEDDGQGMDEEKILAKAAERGLLTKDASAYSTEEILNLVLLPGFSTNESVDQYSGRGVGMDVAHDVVGNLGGSIAIESALGKGTAITMKVPVSMTSTECIRFAVGPYTCLISIRHVVRIYSFGEVEDCLQSIDGRMWFQAEEMLPVLDLFDLYGADLADDDRHLIIIRDTKGCIALLTGPVAGQQTAVEKPLPRMLGRNYRIRTGMIGCTVTETGQLGMMLNADWLIDLCGKERQHDEK